MSAAGVSPFYRKYDEQARRRAARRANERGCSVYIPAAELQKAGYDPYGDPPFYRVWGAPRGRVVIQLYRKTK